MAIMLPSDELFYTPRGNVMWQCIVSSVPRCLTLLPMRRSVLSSLSSPVMSPSLSMAASLTRTRTQSVSPCPLSSTLLSLRGLQVCSLLSPGVRELISLFSPLWWLYLSLTAISSQNIQIGESILFLPPHVWHEAGLAIVTDWRQQSPGASRKLLHLICLVVTGEYSWQSESRFLITSPSSRQAECCNNCLEAHDDNMHPRAESSSNRKSWSGLVWQLLSRLAIGNKFAWMSWPGSVAMARRKLRPDWALCGNNGQACQGQAAWKQVVRKQQTIVE